MVIVLQLHLHIGSRCTATEQSASDVHTLCETECVDGECRQRECEYNCQ